MYRPARQRLLSRKIPAAELALRSHPCVAVSSAQVFTTYQFHRRSILHVLRERNDQPAFLAWGVEQKIELVHIQPGKPVQNAHVESFTGRLRDECLNVHWFRNVWDARNKIALWRTEYNEQRPHSSLGYRTPAEFRAALSFAPNQREYRSAEALSRLPSGSLSLDLDNASAAQSEPLI